MASTPKVVKATSSSHSGATPKSAVPSRNSLKAQQSPKKKRTRKRKSRYKTGTHASVKCVNGSLEFRSSWEEIVAQYFDNCSLVKRYAYEAVAIPYITNVRSGRIRKYYPDFFVKYADGKKLLIEVKRNDKLTNATVMKKAEAGRLWASQNGYEYQFWTNEIIALLKSYNKTVDALQKAKTNQLKETVETGLSKIVKKLETAIGVSHAQTQTITTATIPNFSVSGNIASTTTTNNS